MTIEQIFSLFDKAVRLPYFSARYLLSLLNPIQWGNTPLGYPERFLFGFQQHRKMVSVFALSPLYQISQIMCREIHGYSPKIGGSVKGGASKGVIMKERVVKPGPCVDSEKYTSYLLLLDQVASTQCSTKNTLI